MATGFPSAAMSQLPISRPLTPSVATGAYSGTLSEMEAIRQNLGSAILNASRIKLDPAYLSGIPDGQTALKDPLEIRLTGWPPADRLLGKLKQYQAYSWQAASVIGADTVRGSLLGAVGGGTLGLASGGAVKIAKRSWPLPVLLPLGMLAGGGVGGFGAGTIAFARSAWNMGRHVKADLKTWYQGFNAKSETSGN